MVDSIGNKLKKARLAKGITVEEAARATKIRPARIEDIERDDLSHFPSIVYARGFMRIYAEYLNLDIDPYLEQFGMSSRVSIDGYEYMASGEHDPGSVIPRESASGHSPRLLIAGGVLALILLIFLGIWFVSFTLNRLADNSDFQSGEQTSETSDPEDRPEISPEIQALATTPTATPVATPTATPVATPLPVQPQATPTTVPTAIPVHPPTADGSGTPPAAIPVTEPYPSPIPPVNPVVIPTPGVEPEVPDAPEVRRALPVQSQQTQPTAPADSEFPLTVTSSQRTWVKIIQNDLQSTPVYEDWFSPTDPPIQLNGQKFWITVMDQGAIQIQKNNQPYPYSSTSIVIE